MGKKHGRNVAKTGDKALYKSRNKQQQFSNQKYDSDDNDAMYNKVDRFYNKQDEEDYIELTRGDDSNDDDNDSIQQDAVLNLGRGDMMSSSEDENEEENNDGEEEEGVKGNKRDVIEDDGVSTSASSSSRVDDNNEDEEGDHVRDWGTRKSVYYHGDTADLEIGQEQEDAFVEEEAAKVVETARIKDMSEQDFVLSDDDDEKDKDHGEDKNSRKASLHALTPRHVRDLATKWSTKERQLYLKQHHAEFLPLVNHFADVVEDLEERTDVLVRALYEQGKEDENTPKAIGSTKEGERYLLSRALLQSSIALNLAVYLLLKEDYCRQQSDRTKLEDDILSSHPVLDHLEKLNNLAEKMELTVNNRNGNSSSSLQEQMNSLRKASALIASQVIVEDEDDSDETQEEEEEEGDLEDDEQRQGDNCKPLPDDVQRSLKDDEALNDDSSSSSEEAVENSLQQAGSMHEARFALRLNEVDAGAGSNAQAKKRRRQAVSDFGEDHSEINKTKTSLSLTSTVNTLEQRFAAHKNKISKKTENAMTDRLDDYSDDDENQIRRGLELMEAELGKASGVDDDDDDDNALGNDDAELDDNGDGKDDFYHKVQNASRSKKKQRKERYAVAPKFPRMEPDVAGERAISRTILKNRGLVPHKNKLNRNPRVKKREQYRKALIRRKGAVRAMRDPTEGQAYGGEETGIKSNIRRSRNLT